MTDLKRSALELAGKALKLADSHLNLKLALEAVKKELEDEKKAHVETKEQLAALTKAVPLPSSDQVSLLQHTLKDIGRQIQPVMDASTCVKAIDEIRAFLHLTFWPETSTGMSEFLGTPSTHTARVDALIKQAYEMGFGNSNYMRAYNWMMTWLRQPLAPLNGSCPIDVIVTEEGFVRVRQLLSQMQSGAYA